MPRSAAVTVENNFVNGLVSEATALNFPEAAATETFNCVFNKDGSFERRLGIDFESGYSELTASRTGNVTNLYVWNNAAGSGENNLVVTQIGMTLRFYTLNTGALSDGLLASTIDLSDFVSDALAPDPEEIECQFASGKGYLFVTHQYLEPFYVSYDASLGTVQGTEIALQIRDFEGLDDALANDNRPSTLSDAHKYNLYNQGWEPFSTGGLNDPRPVITGATDYQNDLPTSYNAGDPLATWSANRSDEPSNADVWWLYKDSQNVFQPKEASATTRGNSPAPNGHYLLDAFYQDRSTVSGIAGFTVVDSDYYRPKATAFFAGRVWYAGVDASGFNNKVYFSQIVQDESSFGKCYQENDPTSEYSFDVLASDGGVIQILDAGSVVKLVSLQNALIVFARNGVWTISGSTGTGFTPTDFTVQKISSLPCLTASSFVDVSGMPAWWTTDGIYMIGGASGSGSVQITSLTEKKIKEFFVEDIPAESKRFARGYFNPLTKIVQWLYRSTAPESVSQRNEYDAVLCFDTVTQAFYPWTVDSSVTLNGVVSVSGFSSSNEVSVVTVSGVSVTVDSVDVTVPSFSNVELAGIFKYLVSYPSAGTHQVSFAEAFDTDYLDFTSYDDTGSDYDSYVISGYKVRGDAQRRFQSNYVILFMDMDALGLFDFSAIWDYATSSATGDYGSLQRIDTTTVTGRRYKFRRLKVRGSGLSVQFKIASVSGQPFKIVGWSTFDTANQAV